MGSVNKVILVGNLGRDAELRYTPGGAAVATLNLATTEVFKDREGQKKEDTQWHRVDSVGQDRRNAAGPPDQGQADLRRGQAADAQVEGQGRQRQVHHRGARRPRRAVERRRRWRASRGEGGGGRSSDDRRVQPREPAGGSVELTDDDIPF